MTSARVAKLLAPKKAPAWFPFLASLRFDVEHTASVLAYRLEKAEAARRVLAGAEARLAQAQKAYDAAKGEYDAYKTGGYLDD